MKTRGIVLEVNKQQVTVLTVDGRFCQLPRRGRVTVGEEYSYNSTFKAWYAVAAVFALLLFSSFYSLTRPAVVTAYVSVDINPSLELAISDALEVVAVEAINGEALELLADLNLKNMPLTEALSLILQTAEDKAYLNSDSPALVLAGTFLSDDELLGHELQQVMEEATQKYVVEDQSTVAVVTATRHTREQAQKEGLSVGKYAVLMEAAEEGLALQSVDLQQKGIGRALKDADAHPGEVLRNINRKKNSAPPGQAQKDKFADDHPGNGPTSQPPGQQRNSNNNNNNEQTFPPGNAFGRDK